MVAASQTSHVSALVHTRLSEGQHSTCPVSIKQERNWLLKRSLHACWEFQGLRLRQAGVSQQQPVAEVRAPAHSLRMLCLSAGVYDAAATKRFYITVLNYELDGGMHLGFSQLLIASSVSSNPADGFVGPYTGASSAHVQRAQTQVVFGEEHFRSRHTVDGSF